MARLDIHRLSFAVAPIAVIRGSGGHPESCYTLVIDGFGPFHEVEVGKWHAARYLIGVAENAFEPVKC